MIDIYSPAIIGNQVSNELINRLYVILTTPVGSVPFDRSFGVDFSIVDKPVAIAKGLLTVEYIDKIRRYEDSVEVLSVEFEENENQITPKIRIGGV